MQWSLLLGTLFRLRVSGSFSGGKVWAVAECQGGNRCKSEWFSGAGLKRVAVYFCYSTVKLMRPARLV